MWIRSQDLKALVNVQNIEMDGECEILGFGNATLLGKYSTKEKALKVLDEIQNAVENTNYYNIDNFCLGTYALKRGPQVYQMPQDEDVEV